ncbi:MAG TPA: vitamin K epoxide reductase family protein [Solirubrobacteraceae bacterium]|jgi:uncharacterized membrane protein|nr:vitamin K epoxide reductase family protein [Solirubrobacteraceae bacterium]
MRRPSDRLIAQIMIALTVIGIGVAGYLTIVHYAHIKLLCVGKHSHGVSSCATVQRSQYAEVKGVPVALMGLIGYVVIMGLLTLGPRLRDPLLARLGTVAVTLIGFGFSGYLTYRELFTIHAICEWCVSSAVIMTILMLLAMWRYLTVPLADALPPPEDPPEDRPAAAVPQTVSAR